MADVTHQSRTHADTAGSVDVMSGLEEKHREEVIVEEQGGNWLPAKHSTKNALDFRYNEVWVCMVIASATVKYVSIIFNVFEECVREQINWVLCISCVQHETFSTLCINPDVYYQTWRQPLAPCRVRKQLSGCQNSGECEGFSCKMQTNLRAILPVACFLTC